MYKYSAKLIYELINWFLLISNQSINSIKSSGIQWGEITYEPRMTFDDWLPKWQLTASGDSKAQWRKVKAVEMQHVYFIDKQ